MKLLHTTILAVALIGSPYMALGAEKNAYKEERFVANKKNYSAQKVEPDMVNAWGIAIRPKGAGGHFWVTAGNTSYQYVGDVRKSADTALQKLHVDSLPYVKLPVGAKENFATGVVFSDSDKNFIITQKLEDSKDITAPAKFLFASDGGLVSAWTERKKADGTFERSKMADTVIDQSADGAQFFGLALNHDYSKLYVADFGAKPGIKVFDGTFRPALLTFDQPFDENKNGKVDPGEYAPFNIQALTTPQGEHHLFVTYAKTQPCPVEEVKAGSCSKDELFVGEEDTSKPGQGRVAEFTEEGKLVSIWKDGGKLSAPWGIAYAPENFGALSGRLLVANFGDGKIAAYDAKSREFVEFLKDEKGRDKVIDKVWGIVFGNGESLGDANALYFAAGPDDEKDGLFGSLRPVE
ncbi:MAG: TIGR03118 family protein [Rickettsiales bacterium]